MRKIALFLACWACDGSEPGPGPVERTAVEAGSGCTGRGELEPATLDEFTRQGNLWSITRSFGCGCPSDEPEFTLVYDEGEPVRLWLCHDEGADPCEALCEEELVFEVPDAVADADDVVLEPT